MVEIQYYNTHTSILFNLCWNINRKIRLALILNFFLTMTTAVTFYNFGSFPPGIHLQQFQG
jgi:hypothetical protein